MAETADPSMVKRGARLVVLGVLGIFAGLLFVVSGIVAAWEDRGFTLLGASRIVLGLLACWAGFRSSRRGREIQRDHREIRDR
jgi:hypothetical protein